MRKIANIAAGSFIFFVIVLSAVSVFGIWDVLKGDVIWKSFQSIGLLAAVAAIVIAADNITKSNSVDVNGNKIPIYQDSETIAVFKTIRTFTTGLLIFLAVALALFGLMAIWEVIDSKNLYKIISSIAVIGFSSLIVVIVCLNREGGKRISGQ